MDEEGRESGVAAYEMTLLAKLREIFTPKPLYCVYSHLFTLCSVRSVVMFCFVLFLKFRLPIWLHSSCTVAAVAAQRPVEHSKKAL